MENFFSNAILDDVVDYFDQIPFDQNENVHNYRTIMFQNAFQNKIKFIDNDHCYEFCTRDCSILIEVLGLIQKEIDVDILNVVDAFNAAYSLCGQRFLDDQDDEFFILEPQQI